MARARKKKQSISWTRIALIVMLLLWVALAVAWWSLRSRRASPASVPATTQVAGEHAQGLPSSTQPAVADGGVVQVKGKLQIGKPVRDTQIGVSADAAILFRIVEMYQWHERCELSGGACAYEASWSQGHVDSGKFRAPKGHENPPAPFADARFSAAEIRLGDLVVDPKLLDAQAAVDYPVKASALPPNLEATFSVIDGALYAGGDAAHPQVGTVRVRYRIVPAGEVALSGVKRGDRLELK